MASIDKLLQEARMLKAAESPYQPLCILEKLESGRWSVQGFDGALFDTEAQAVQFCEDQAAGRSVSIVVFDIPHILPDGDYIFPAGENIDSTWEVGSNAAANANGNGHPPDAPTNF